MAITGSARPGRGGRAGAPRPADRSAGPSSTDTTSRVLGAPPIVFVHATRLTRDVGGPGGGPADAFRVITLDLPGHGVRATERFTLDDAADAVGRVIDEAADGRAVVVGLSSAATWPWTSRRDVPSASAGWSSRARPRAGRARRRRRTGPSAGSWPRSTATRLETAQPLVLPDPLRTGDRGADRRWRLLGGGGRGGAPLPRRPALQAAAGGVRRAQPHRQRRARPALPPRSARLRWAAAQDARHVRLPRATHLVEPRPAGGLQRAVRALRRRARLT